MNAQSPEPSDPVSLSSELQIHDLGALLVGVQPQDMRGVFDWGDDIGREIVD